MSLAWGAIVLLVLLLPGFLFSVGIYFPERFTRQVAEKSALGQLAGVVLVSFLVHGLFFVINAWTCQHHCVRIDYMVLLITFNGSNQDLIATLADNITRYHLAIFSYILSASLAGLLIGISLGVGAVQGRISFLVQHRWVHTLLIAEPHPLRRIAKWCCKSKRARSIPFIASWAGLLGREVTAAYILTKISYEGRILLYRGYLKNFSLNSSGSLGYVILAQPVRLYLTLEEKQPTSSPKETWLAIGIGAPGTVQQESNLSELSDSPHLLVDGDQIANLVFDRETLPPIVSEEEFQKLVERKQAERAQAAAEADMPKAKQSYRARLKTEFTSIPEYADLAPGKWYQVTFHDTHPDYMHFADERGRVLYAQKRHFEIEPVS